MSGDGDRQEQSPAVVGTCACGHPVVEHYENGCGWCICKVAGPARGLTRRCEVCHLVLPLDAFPPDSVICDADYRLVGVDAWDVNDDS